MSSDPGIRAIWKMSSGVGNRNVLMYGVVRGHNYDCAMSKWATMESAYGSKIGNQALVSRSGLRHRIEILRQMCHRSKILRNTEKPGHKALQS